MAAAEPVPGISTGHEEFGQEPVDAATVCIARAVNQHQPSDRSHRAEKEGLMSNKDDVRVPLQKWSNEFLDLPFRGHGSGLTCIMIIPFD